jgi:very-short-patch-repair endonuclease
LCFATCVVRNANPAFRTIAKITAGAGLDPTIKTVKKNADIFRVSVSDFIEVTFMASKEKQGIETKDSLAFIKEVAKYYMDFLETDFHKRKNPKRRIQFRSSDNLLIGLNLNKYPSFTRIVWKAINRAFEEQVLNTIQKGIYRTKIPKHLLDLVKSQSEKIDNKQVTRILEQSAREIEKSAAMYKADYDQALSSSLGAVESIIKANLVVPLVNSLEKPLENLDAGDENNIFLMEEELTSILRSFLENKISEVLKLLLSKEKVDIVKQLTAVFEVQDIKSNISSFFENFQVEDLFAELYEMERNRTILDKQEFYLYFCDITYDKIKYPVFYIPFSVRIHDDSLDIEFDSQVYINKKALEYITQEYNQAKNKKGSLKTITERIIYLAEHQGNFQRWINGILSEIVNFFELDKSIDLTDPEPQVAKSFLVRLSNNCYVALFDKSDEALVNDYEEILKLLSSGNSVLADAFNKLIDDFIHKNPQPFNPTIEEEWDNAEISDRLVFRSPIPLNSEQLQILSAVKREGCKYIVVEGPPGTGKSHTITAIVFDSILKNQSVLVLSDKKEALDVVEEKVTETMNKVRYDKNFQNPILRLGRTGSTYSQILATPTIESIKTHFRAVKKNYDELESSIEKSINTLKEDLESEILAYNEIELEEIHELIGLESYFNKNGFPFGIDEALKNSESAGELEELRSILLDLKAKVKDYDFNFLPLSKPSLSLVNSVRSAISLLERFLIDYKDYFGVDDIRDKALRLHETGAELPLAEGQRFPGIESLENELSSYEEIYRLFNLERPKQFTDVDVLLKALSFVKHCLDELNSTFGTRLSALSISANLTDSNHDQLKRFITQYEQIKKQSVGLTSFVKRLSLDFRKMFGKKLHSLDYPAHITDDNYTEISTFINKFVQLKRPIIGYMFNRKKVRDLDTEFQSLYKCFDADVPSTNIKRLRNINIIIHELETYRYQFPDNIKGIDFYQTMIEILRNEQLSVELVKLGEELTNGDTHEHSYEKTGSKIINYFASLRNQILELNSDFRRIFKAEESIEPQKHLEKLKEIDLIITQISAYKDELPLTIKGIDLVESMTTLLKDDKLQEKFEAVLDLATKYKYEISQIQKAGWYKTFTPKDINELRKLEIAAKALSAFFQYKTISDLTAVISVDDITRFLDKGNLSAELERLKKYSDFLALMTDNFEDISYVVSLLNRYPAIANQMKINKTDFKTFTDNELLKIGDVEYSKVVRYLSLYHKIRKDFEHCYARMSNYLEQKTSIEDLVTTQMTFLLDKKFIDFYENNKATAKVLRDIIRAKRRFPKDEFQKLKEAFPCILAGIRDYAEYIPLEPEIFDLVIIDEASQVSIAQAFPALLRAKKVLILGDKKQFSNVKTAQARTDINREYLSSLTECFKKNISNEPVKLVKLDKFNIKTSILEFFEFISNYNAQLLKYFRGYKEIISYSNKYFYHDSLQVMKIRSKSIDEVLKFSFIKHDGKREPIQNTNTLEAEFIISELRKLKDINSNKSVGIITPHTNQQKRLVEMINRVPERDYFYDKLNLKIMTFDTCQGEERDICFYSMVATEEDDHLWGVFIRNLDDVDREEEGRIKVQRLNVGFSRAKECMHFVLSKPLEKYSGSIGDALRHYNFILNETKKERSVSEVDGKSKMEPEVMHWFYQTDFWRRNKEKVTFIPQFEIGKYLKQLDRTYNHPNYKVDFLLVYKDKADREHKIVIEYDGFEHFKEVEGINEFNYQEYMRDEDIYREKVLEGYGYRFLRINKFNAGDDPVKTLSDRIENLIKGRVDKNNLISDIHQTIEDLQNSKMRECPKCKQIRHIEDFRDDSLTTGYGRFCKFCKGHVSVGSVERKTRTAKTVTEEKICPRCGSKMVLRTGRFGKFYGCSKFPYCKGTRPY